jgi:hypothetical protein
VRRLKMKKEVVMRWEVVGSGGWRNWSMGVRKGYGLMWRGRGRGGVGRSDNANCVKRECGVRRRRMNRWHLKVRGAKEMC